MEMLSLQNTYPAICKYKEDAGVTYGGNQVSSASRTIRRCGCGVISCLDLLLYLDRYCAYCQSDLFPQLDQDAPISLKTYDALAQQLCRQYFPLVPPLGMNVLVMVMGLNRYFRSHHIMLRAHWGVVPGKLWHTIDSMLEHDLPVIMAIGQNFPFLWQKAKCGLYQQTSDARLLRARATKAHYVNITGSSETWIRVSSWGQMYFMNKNEYMRYVEQHSSYLFSNIVRLEIR